MIIKKLRFCSSMPINYRTLLAKTSSPLSSRVAYIGVSLTWVGSRPKRAFRVILSSEYLSSGLNRAALAEATWVGIVRVLAVLELHLQGVDSLSVLVQVIT